MKFAIPNRTAILLTLLFAFLIQAPIMWMSYQGTKSAPSVYESRITNNTDAIDYLRLAENLVENGVYSTSDQEPYVPELKRVPGYPFFLAFLYFIAGGQHSPLLILAANMLLLLLNILLIMLIGQEFFSKEIGILAGILYALAPISLSLANQAMSESLFTFLILLTFYFVIRWELNSWSRIIIGAIGLGALLALATYVRAIALYMLPIFLLYWVFRFPKIKEILVLIGVCFPVFAAIISPWYLRNHNEFDVYTFSSVSDGNIITYNAASVYATENRLVLRDAKNALIEELGQYLAEHPEIDDSNPAILAAAKRHIAMSNLLRNPVLSLLVHIKDAVNSFRPGYSQMNLVFFDLDVRYGNNVGTGKLPQISELSLAQILAFGFATFYYGLVYLGFVLGYILIIVQRQWLKFYILLAIPVWFAIVPSIAGNSRFRVPFEGIMALLTSFVLVFIWHYVQKRLRQAESK